MKKYSTILLVKIKYDNVYVSLRKNYSTYAVKMFSKQNERMLRKLQLQGDVLQNSNGIFVFWTRICSPFRLLRGLRCLLLNCKVNN